MTFHSERPMELWKVEFREAYRAKTLPLIGPMAARVLVKAARCGWSIARLQLARSGTVYFELRRGGVRYKVRVSNHRSFHWRERNGRLIDLRTNRNPSWVLQLLARG